MAQSDPPQVVLARRLELLMDATAVERGKPYTWSEVQQFVQGEGVKLSRARWSYMLNGTGGLVTDSRLLLALARLFKVDIDYLVDLESTAVPPRVEAQLHLIRSMREARVQAFAARSVGEMSPGLMNAISDYLQSHGEAADR